MVSSATQTKHLISDQIFGIPQWGWPPADALGLLPRNSSRRSSRALAFEADGLEPPLMGSDN